LKKTDIVPTNFIESIIVDDLNSGKHDKILTRFPPEPNGYLHVGHAKSLAINFGIKNKFGGTCYLRYDDTNPEKEEKEYVDSIKEDIKWLGHAWDKELYASDYFETMYKCAVLLIKKGLAFVCDYSDEEISRTRGTFNEPGEESKYRNRSVEENLELFENMRKGLYEDGSRVLRAKIDMASPNMNMRDPVIYRISRTTHHRTKDKWVIYPMYDFAHPIEDAIEHITHSICTLEFEDHRPLYDWVVENCEFDPKPRQIEFARLNIKNTIMSKRFLKKLVDDGFVDGWDDPRMPTISGMRNRGYPPEAINEFCERIGVAKANSEVEPSLLEFCIRENLNKNADRAMVVESPLLVTIENIGEGEFFEFDAVDNPQNENSKKHKVTLKREIFIESTDFALVPPPKYHRLVEGGKIRLKGAYIIEHVKTILDKNGNVESLVCRYIPDSASGGANAKIKVKATVQWVSKEDAVDVELHNFEHLLNDETPEIKDFSKRLNYNSRKIIKGAKAEPFVLEGEENKRFQFMRNAYYKRAKKVDGIWQFYRIVSLKESYTLM